MKKVFVFGLYNFPHGDATSNRLLSVAKALKKGGLEPFVVGKGSLRENDYDYHANAYEVEGVRYTSIRTGDEKLPNRIIQRLLPLYKMALEVYRADLRTVLCIYTTLGTVSFGLVFLCRYVWRRPLIIDCMEWFEPSQFSAGWLSPYYLKFLFRFRFLCNNANIVGISTKLCNEFKRRGCRTLRMPPQVDLARFNRHELVTSMDRIELFYAGTAARKDYVGTALQGLQGLDPTERSRFRFTIAGPTRAELASMLGSEEAIKALGESVNIIGRISRDQVLLRLAQSHFTVLLRPVSRYSDAGFPSKIPETLAAGTPPILTITSDLNHYLKDKLNGIVVEDCSPDAFSQALRRVLTLSIADWNAMSINAVKCASDNFDYNGWAFQLCEFVDNSI